jgi:hypothetical protein
LRKIFKKIYIHAIRVFLFTDTGEISSGKIPNNANSIQFGIKKTKTVLKNIANWRKYLYNTYNLGNGGPGTFQ